MTENQSASFIDQLKLKQECFNLHSNVEHLQQKIAEKKLGFEKSQDTPNVISNISKDLSPNSSIQQISKPLNQEGKFNPSSKAFQLKETQINDSNKQIEGQIIPPNQQKLEQERLNLNFPTEPPKKKLKLKVGNFFFIFDENLKKNLSKELEKWNDQISPHEQKLEQEGLKLNCKTESNKLEKESCSDSNLLTKPKINEPIKLNENALGTKDTLIEEPISVENFEFSLNFDEWKTEFMTKNTPKTQEKPYRKVVDGSMIKLIDDLSSHLKILVKNGKVNTSLINQYFDSFLSLAAFYCGSTIREEIKKNYTLEGLISDLKEMQKISNMLKNLTKSQKEEFLKELGAKNTDTVWEIGNITVRMNDKDHKIESRFSFLKRSQKTNIFKWTELGLLIPSRNFKELWANAVQFEIDELMNLAHKLHKILRRQIYHMMLKENRLNNLNK